MDCFYLTYERIVVFTVQCGFIKLYLYNVLLWTLIINSYFQKKNHFTLYLIHTRRAYLISILSAPNKYDAGSDGTTICIPVKLSLSPPAIDLETVLATTVLSFLGSVSEEWKKNILKRKWLKLQYLFLFLIFRHYQGHIVCIYMYNCWGIFVFEVAIINISVTSWRSV